MCIRKGFVVATGKPGLWVFRSFHNSVQEAEQALRKRIDINALRVLKAEVTFASNGNVRLWRSMDLIDFYDDRESN